MSENLSFYTKCSKHLYKFSDFEFFMPYWINYIVFQGFISLYYENFFFNVQIHLAKSLEDKLYINFHHFYKNKNVLQKATKKK